MNILSENQINKYGFGGYSGTNYRDFSLESCKFTISYGRISTRLPIPGGNLVFWVTIYLADSHFTYYIVNTTKTELEKLTNISLFRRLIKRIPFNLSIINEIYNQGQIHGKNKLRSDLKDLLTNE